MDRRRGGSARDYDAEAAVATGPVPGTITYNAGKNI